MFASPSNTLANTLPAAKVTKQKRSPTTPTAVASEAAGPASNTVAHSPLSVEETPGNATYCFAGYRADYRTREENTLYADKMGYSIKLEQNVQLIDNGRWTDVATTTASAWLLLKEWGRGTYNKGWGHELRDSDGNALMSESESTDLIASGGSSEVALTDRCDAQRDAMVDTANAVVETFFVACKVATLPIPDSAEGEVSLKPLGVGGTVNVTKNQDFCGNIKGGQASYITMAGSVLYADCLENPGRYFPADYPPEQGSLDLKILPGFESPYAVLVQDGNAPANCPASYVSHEAVDMGGGTTCSADVRYSCEKTVSGACECGNPQVEGQIDCVTVEGGTTRE